jgi:hypothetical protein
MANDYYENIKAGSLDPRADVQAEAARVRQEVQAVSNSENPESENDRNKTIFESSSMIPAAVRAYERRGSQFEKDLDFKVDDDMRMAWDTEYNSAEIEDLETARSPTHMLQIKKDIQTDRDRNSLLSSYGSSGVVQSVVTTLLDPPALVMMAITGGYSNVASGGRLVRALKMAGASAAEMAAYEITMEAGDTQKSVNDVYLGMALGGLIGTGIGALTKAKAGKEIADMDYSISVDAKRAQVVSQEKELIEGGAKPPHTKDFNDPNIDTVAVNKAVKDHEVSLRSKADGTITEVDAKGVTHKRQVSTPRMLQSAIKKFEKKKVQLIETAKTKLKEITNNKGVAKILAKESEEAATLIKSKAKTIKSFDAQIAAAEKKAAKLEANVNKQAKFYKAKEELAAITAKRDSAVRLLENNSKKRMAKLREEQLGARMKLAATRDAAVAKLDRAVSKMTKDSEVARTTNAAKSKLKKWEKLTPSERALEATKGELPMRDINAAKAEVDNLTTTDLSEQATGGSASSQKVGDKGSETVFDDITPEDKAILHSLIEEGANVDESLIGTRIYSMLGQPVADRLQALHTTLGNSKSFVVRGLNHMLFESAQGGKARGLTASGVAESNKRQILGAARGRLGEGFSQHLDDFAKGNPKESARLSFDPVFKSDFHKQVMMKVENPTLEVSEAITNAADGVRDLYKKAAEISKNSGRQGFQNLKVRDNYITKVVNPTLYKRLVAKSGFGIKKAKQLIPKGYQEGFYKLNKEAADRLADARHIQLTEGNLTMRGALSKYGTANVDQMKKDLKAAGVDDDIIEDLLENTLAKDLEQGISNRAKKSLDPSLTSEIDGVKLVDIIENDLGKMTEGYARETAGEAALAQVVGAKTVGQMSKILRLAEKALVNAGMTEKRIAEEMQMLQDGVDMLLGKSINKEAGSPLVTNLSRLRDFTGLLRLQNMGLASFPETARAITSYGLGAVLEAVPNLGIFSSKGLRGGKMSGKMTRADLEELDEIMSYYGDDWALHDQSIRYESFEDIGQTGKLTQLIDTAMAQGRRLQGVTSGFRAIQGAGEKIALRSLSSRMKNQLLYGKKPLKQWQINDAGWSKTVSSKFEKVDGVMQKVTTTSDFMDDVSVWMKANPKKATVNGREIDVFNFENMPADMQQRLQVGMQRLVYRDMQRMNVGETSTFMNKWLGQTLFQFRGFPLASVAKQLVHDVKADKMHAANTLMVSAGMAYMAMGVNSALKSVGREDGYMEKNMTGSNAILQILGRTGQLSATSLVGDGLATLSLLPDEMYSGQGRMGYKAMGADYVPIVGVAGDVTNMAKDIVDYGFGDTTGSRVAKDAQNLIPFMKTIGVGQAISYTIKED